MASGVKGRTRFQSPIARAGVLARLYYSTDSRTEYSHRVNAEEERQACGVSRRAALQGRVDRLACRGEDSHDAVTERPTLDHGSTEPTMTERNTPSRWTRRGLPTTLARLPSLHRAAALEAVGRRRRLWRAKRSPEAASEIDFSKARKVKQ